MNIKLKNFRIHNIKHKIKVRPFHQEPNDFPRCDVFTKSWEIVFPTSNDYTKMGKVDRVTFYGESDH